jgi:ATP-binding protein involved in chromosome partitioning
MTPTSDAVLAALADLKDPETGRSLRQTGQLKADVQGDMIVATLALTTHSKPLWNDVAEQARQTLAAKFSGQATVRLVELDRSPQKLGQIGLTAKSVIAVGSGKGGVGKSTIAASLALGLKRAGCKVGLMDADVYGPSIPHLLGLGNAPRPEVIENRIQPPKFEGMPVISIGFLVPPGEAVVWRGPMLHGAITNFLRDTNWGDLDYLIIDMPPGTGDIALTLSQMLPLSGAVVVCTPQEVALLDAVKAIAMFRKVNIPILGMVENMSGFVCPDCGTRYDIFGAGGARQKAEELDVPFLGEVPITMSVRENGDAGQTQANFTDPQAAPYFERIVYKLAKHLADSVAVKPVLPSLPVLG